MGKRLIGMKTNELDAEQLSKLIELCKKAFPEYLEIEIIGDEKDPFVIFRNENKEKKIHWFELCVNQLSRSLYKYIWDDLIGHEHFCVSVLLNFIYKKDNPIDFLYDEIRKIEIAKASGYSPAKQHMNRSVDNFYEVYLIDGGDRKLSVIKELKTHGNFSLVESKKLTDQLYKENKRVLIKTRISIGEARAIEHAFIEIGAKVKIHLI